MILFVFSAVKTCIKDIFKESFDAVFDHLANGGKGSGRVKSHEVFDV